MTKLLLATLLLVAPALQAASEKDAASFKKTYSNCKSISRFLTDGVCTFGIGACLAKLISNDYDSIKPLIIMIWCMIRVNNTSAGNEIIGFDYPDSLSASIKQGICDGMIEGVSDANAQQGCNLIAKAAILTSLFSWGLGY